MNAAFRLFKFSLLLGYLALSMPVAAIASEAAHAVAREYPVYANAPAAQLPSAVTAKNNGCMSCHIETDQPSMHASRAVNLACVDCHGGNHEVRRPDGASPGDQN